MMNRLNDARIFELITQKLLGTILLEDDVVLQHAMARNPQVKRCWDELYEANELTGGTLLQELELPDAWVAVSVPAPQQRIIFRRIREWMEQAFWMPLRSRG